ncbi:hypothetical protein D6783_01485 [Candidatus Woesearchaeota archaeon]|nr:MAG: hypothetical protein D6783_01485 [Candidatus Woesearchaeota archaeon]
MSFIVTVRMPETLHAKLLELAPEHHYKDLSELMRNLIRERAAAYLANSFPATSSFTSLTTTPSCNDQHAPTRQKARPRTTQPAETNETDELINTMKAIIARLEQERRARRAQKQTLQNEGGTQEQELLTTETTIETTTETR